MTPDTNEPRDGDLGTSSASPATDALGDPPTAPKVVVPRWIQLVTLPLALLAIWAIARAAGPVLLVFIVAAVIALILNPLVSLLERRRIPRGLAVACVYVGFFAVLVGIGALLASPVTSQIQAFQHEVPSLVRSANRSLADVQRFFDQHGVGIHIRRQGQTALQTLQGSVVKRSGALVSFTGDLVQRVAKALFELVLIVVASVYILVYSRSIGRLVRAVMPVGDGTREDDYPYRAQRAVFVYVRTQLAFSAIMGTTAGVALFVFGLVGLFPAGRSYAVFFGLFFGLMELVPYVGPLLGALPPILVALFGHPLDAVWVALLFLGIQQLEGHVVAPQLFGRSLRVNPLIVIFSLLFGFEIFGIIGAIVALPLAAVARETVIYLRRHLVLEAWSRQPVSAPGSSPPSSPSPGSSGVDDEPLLGVGALSDSQPRCATCGAVGEPDDAYCRACGAPLAPRVGTPG